MPGSGRDISCMGSCSGSPGQGACSLPWRRAAAGRIQAVLASVFLPPPDPLSVRAALRDGVRGRLLDRSVRGSIIISHTSSGNSSEGMSRVSSHISSLSASSSGNSTCSTIPKHHSERTYPPTQPPDIEGADDTDGENRGAAALGMWMSGPSLPPPRSYYCDAPSDPCADIATAAAAAASAGDSASLGAAAGAAGSGGSAAGLADGGAGVGDGVVAGVGGCKCIVLDFSAVTLLDLTGMEALREVLHEVREAGGAAAVVHLHPALASRLARFGLRNDALPGARAGVVGGRGSGVWAVAGWGEGLPLRARGARRVLGSRLVLPEPLVESGLEEEKEDEVEEVWRGDGDSYNRI